MAAPTQPAKRSELRARVYVRLLTTEAKQQQWPPASVNDALNVVGQDIHQELLQTHDSALFTREWGGLVSTQVSTDPPDIRIQKPSDLERATGLFRRVGDEWAKVEVYDPVMAPSASPVSYGDLGALSARTLGTSAERWIEFDTYWKGLSGVQAGETYRTVGQSAYVPLQQEDQYTTIPNAWIELLVDGTAARLAADVGEQRFMHLQRDYANGLARLRRQAALRSLARHYRTQDVYRRY